MSDEAARRWSQQSNRKRRGETSDADSALKNIRSSTERRLPTAETRRMIVAHFQEHDDLSVPTYRVSLICPLSKRRMSVAAHGVDCTHIQCFDLEQYLQFQVQNSLWACPIAGCSKQLREAQLRVDQYFCNALESLSDRPYVTELDLIANGDYAIVEPRVVSACEDVPDDGSPDIPAPVQPKHEPLDAMATSACDATPANVSMPAEPVAAELSLVDGEEPLQSRTSSRRRQRKSNMRHGPSKKALLDALAQKDAELKRREEQLTSANEEIQRLRKMLAGKERHESMFRQHFSETDADRAPLRQSLEDAQRCPCKEAPDQCSPCEIRSLQEQIDTVQRGSWALTWEIAQIETVKSDIQSLEETVGQIATRGSHHDDNENTDKSRITACLLADPRSIRGELLPAYRNQRLPATKHEALALLRERLESSEQQEQQLRQKLQKAKGSSPAGN